MVASYGEIDHAQTTKQTKIKWDLDDMNQYDMWYPALQRVIRSTRSIPSGFMASTTRPTDEELGLHANSNERKVLMARKE